MRRIEIVASGSTVLDAGVILAKGEERKRERNIACLNCENYLNCDHIAEYEICNNFVEFENEVWNIKRIDDN